MDRYPTQLERNDTKAALRWVEEYFMRFGGPPDEDAMAILLQLQDEPDELEEALDELFARHEAKPEELLLDPTPSEK